MVRHRQFGKVIILSVLALATVGVPAVAQSTLADSPFEAEMSGQVNITGWTSYASAHPSVVYKLWWFGAGLGTKFYSGLSQQDFYIAPYIRLEFLWFYLGAGYSFPLLEPGTAGFYPAGMEPFFTLGISAAPLRFAFGHLGFDLTLDAIYTALPVLPSYPADPTFLEFIFVYALSRVKAGLGITYAFPL